MTDTLLTELSNILDFGNSDGAVVELPDGAPFNPEQRQWLNGLLTGINTIAAAANAASAEAAYLASSEYLAPHSCFPRTVRFLGAPSSHSAP